MSDEISKGACDLCCDCAGIERDEDDVLYVCYECGRSLACDECDTREMCGNFRVIFPDNDEDEYDDDECDEEEYDDDECDEEEYDDDDT
jgi:hypothetical protein